MEAVERISLSCVISYVGRQTLHIALALYHYRDINRIPAAFLLKQVVWYSRSPRCGSMDITAQYMGLIAGNWT